MYKKIRVCLVVIGILSICVSAFLFQGCEDDTKPKSVQIEVYHPDIEGKIDCGGYFMKYDGSPKIFDIKIYGIKDKRYLTNDDLVKNDLNFLTAVLVRKNEETISTRIDMSKSEEWPTEVGKYHFYITFNSLKNSDMNDPNYYGSPAIWFDLYIEEEVTND